MRVRFADEARSSLRAIHAYVSQDSPKNADALIDRITLRAARIGELPRAGRRVPEHPLDTLREVLERPYRIIYRIKTHEIEIIAVMHYRRLLPSDLLRS